METTKTPAKAMPDRRLAWAAVVVGLLVVVTVGVLAFRQPLALTEGTPEATVQAYVQAVIDGDEDAAVALLHADLECDARHLGDAHIGDDVRVTLHETEVDDATAEIEVVVTTVSGNGPFDVYEYDERYRFELVRQDGQWVITHRPWPYAACGEVTR